MRSALHGFAFTLAAACAFVAPRAHAEPRTGYLAEQLKANDDYRVRTQAALALGASNDDEAVKPLCAALGDSSVPVRLAAAAALGKLGRPSGGTCLRQAFAAEAAPNVKSQIEKSIGDLQGASRVMTPPPPPGPDAKFYVAIQITNKTARPSDEIEALVRGAIQSKILASPAYAVAPKEETVAQGGQVVKKKKLKGYFLLATVEPPVYEGGSLTEVVRVSVWTYPGKSLLGEFSPKLTQSDTRAGDTKSESSLMKMCAERAIETFQKSALSM